MTSQTSSSPASNNLRTPPSTTVTVDKNVIEAARRARGTLSLEAGQLLDEDLIEALLEKSSTPSQVEHYLKTGADVNFSGHCRERTYSMLTIEISCQCRAEVVRLLLEHGAKTTAFALVEAILRQRADIVSLLLSCDLSFGKRLSQSMLPVIAAIFMDSGKLIRKFYERIESPYQRNLMLAASLILGAVDVTTFLLHSNKADQVEKLLSALNKRDRCDSSALLALAVTVGDLNQVKSLLKKAPPDPKTYSAFLMSVILTDDPDLVSLVFSFYDEEALGPALVDAVSAGRTQSCRVLLSNGIRFNGDTLAMFDHHFPPRTQCIQLLHEFACMPSHESKCPCMCKKGCEIGGDKFEPATTVFTQNVENVWKLQNRLLSISKFLVETQQKQNALRTKTIESDRSSASSVRQTTGSPSKVTSSAIAEPGKQRKMEEPKKSAASNQRSQTLITSRNLQTTQSGRSTTSQMPIRTLLRPAPVTNSASRQTRTLPNNQSSQSRIDFLSLAPTPWRLSSGLTSNRASLLNSSNNMSSSLYTSDFPYSSFNSSTNTNHNPFDTSNDDWNDYNNWNNNNNNDDDYYYNNTTNTTYDTYDPNVGYCHW